jgi:peptidoglycan biosynthesis protein MviN/MurJ (putative lipid II flippase)
MDPSLLFATQPELYGAYLASQHKTMIIAVPLIVFAIIIIIIAIVLLDKKHSTIGGIALVSGLIMGGIGSFMIYRHEKKKHQMQYMQ